MSYGKFQLRRDTAANWLAANPVLADGELGIETDTEPYKAKIGNGVDAWADRPYWMGSGSYQNYVHQQPTALSTWTVAHNLGRFPSVTVADHLGNVVLSDVQFLDTNTLQISHSTPFMGVAYCN